MKTTTTEYAEDREDLGLFTRQLVRADLKRAIDRAADAGLPWSEIVRIVADSGLLADPSQPANQDSARAN
jgi:hypothetical protein